MDDVAELLQRAATMAADDRATLPDRPVAAASTTDELWRAFGGPLPDGPAPAGDVLDALAAAADVGSPGGTSAPSTRG